jgi:hypothetical protein
MIRNAVDLPQPEGPSSERNSPSRTSSVRPASAAVPVENVLPTSRSATSTVPEKGAGGMVEPLFYLLMPISLVSVLQRVTAVA